jgi:hypothetical protein
MAHKENIRQRVIDINPKAWDFIKEVEKRHEEKTGEKMSTFILTEDMTPEEEKMTILEYFLKKGLPYEEAEIEAEEFYREIQKTESMLEKIEREKGKL